MDPELHDAAVALRDEVREWIDDPGNSDDLAWFMTAAVVLYGADRLRVKSEMLRRILEELGVVMSIDEVVDCYRKIEPH